MKPTVEQEQAIQRAMMERGLSRKSAAQFVRRQAGKPSAAETNTPANKTDLDKAADTITGHVHVPAAPQPESVQNGALVGGCDLSAEIGGGSIPVEVKPLDLGAAITAQHEAATVAPTAPAEQPVEEKAAPAPKRRKKAATATPENGTAPAPKGKRGRKGKIEGFDSAKAVELYKAGGKVVDIAVTLGYPRGQGQNRVRQALMQAGVYKEKSA